MEMGKDCQTQSRINKVLLSQYNLHSESRREKIEQRKKEIERKDEKYSRLRSIRNKIGWRETEEKRESDNH